jgi:hypothetical protein
LIAKPSDGFVRNAGDLIMDAKMGLIGRITNVGSSSRPLVQSMTVNLARAVVYRTNPD